MVYAIISRVFYVLGILFMFSPMLMEGEMRQVFIPCGAFLSFLGITLMGPFDEKKQTNENILDDGEF